MFIYSAITFILENVYTTHQSSNILHFLRFVRRCYYLNI